MIKKRLFVSMLALSVALLGVGARLIAQERLDKTVSLDLKDASGEDALSRLCEAGGAKHSLNAAARSALVGAKVTASIKNADFNAAIQALAGALGLACEVKGGEVTLTKAPAQSASGVVVKKPELGAKGSGTISITVTRGDGANVRSFAFSCDGSSLFKLPECPQLDRLLNRLQLEPRIYTRSLFLGGKQYTCQHCKKTSTIQTTTSARECTQCKRALMRDYKFCPFDGAAAPADSSAPKYCPLCGKELGPQPEKKESTRPIEQREKRIIYAL